MSDDTPAQAAAFSDGLFDLVRAGRTGAVLDQVDSGVPVDLADAQGSTLLTLAAYYGHADLVAGLAERGADVDRVSGRGQTPLAGAVFKQHDEVIRVLLAAGADRDAGAPSARETAEMFGRALPAD
ncbi:ankyrin repeat domain-containing protein [Microbacterium sp. NPDC096154]|uniref:ankyrin repeat domain-containing protein n=1 Tax=Microbacterium sp. NPDC096154 TaxID=3155549 RepID=UPI0033311185